MKTIITPPTARQLEYLELIYEFHLANELYPRAIDLVHLLEVSPQAVHYVIKTLARDKWIVSENNRILGLKPKTLIILSS